MKYKSFKDANKIINRSDYLITNPETNKNSWNSFFGNNNPIHLELGTGRGDFIINMALANPKINFVGLEISEDQLVKAVQKLNNKNIPNLALICADAHDIDLIFGREISTIYLTFSEPWPKAHNEKNRFTHEGYLKLYDKIFKKDKRIVMKTDNKGLFQYSLQSLSQYWYVFDRVSLDLHNDENPIKNNVMTDWEKKCVQDKKPIYYVDASFKG